MKQVVEALDLRFDVFVLRGHLRNDPLNACDVAIEGGAFRPSRELPCTARSRSLALPLCFCSRPLTLSLRVGCRPLTLLLRPLALPLRRGRLRLALR
ncbi:hypothetical protein A5681_26195 [Mycobacterium scrofulaceum]|nr:hypothetical protein A5681_26195 [Mycobacterium scrofulaceum]